MRLLICGDRDWSNKELIKTWIVHLSPSVIIEGEARGADSLARDAGLELGLEVLPYPARWQEGRSAGYNRNTQMLDEGKPDMVVAFHDDLEHSKGTKNMVEQARYRGIVVILVTSKVPLPNRLGL